MPLELVSPVFALPSHTATPRKHISGYTNPTPEPPPQTLIPPRAGLIIGTGTALKFGPGSLLIGYVLMGFVVYVVMVALGEMGAWLPHKKSFSGYATRFVDPAMGFATGWNYFFKYVIVLPNNLTATGTILSYWLPNLNVSVWIVVFGVVIILLNVGGLHPPPDKERDAD